MAFVIGVGVWWGVQLALNPVGQWWRAAVLVACIVVAARSLVRYFARDARGNLRFDGEGWWYQPLAPGQALSEQPVQIKVLADAQTWVCLQMRWAEPPANHAKTPPVSLWLSGDIQSPGWIAMRRALLASPRIITPHALTV